MLRLADEDDDGDDSTTLRLTVPEGYPAGDATGQLVSLNASTPPSWWKIP
jgi:hypothetical protein